MSWIEVKANFRAAPADWSPFIDVFSDHGCENTLQTDNPPSLSSAVVNVSGSTKVVEEIKRALLNLGVDSVESRDLVDENWEENWKQFFKPRRVGQRFVVRPTWEEFHLSPNDLEIILDPGQAFGTGDHPTTRMCLELLEKEWQPGASVADIGCGSGILSVGACKLGAREVVAVDIEPLSVEVAKENADLNRVQFSAICGKGVTALPDGVQFDIVISNIISATLINIAHEVARVVKVGGKWIVSGIIDQNWPDVRAAAEKSGFELSSELHELDWVGASFARKN
jgi:ribosomal protein L11 methyltransferase